MRRKLQVFVSSTYADLVAERQAAVQAILEAGHIPAGMELFTAGDESQLETIKRWIDESDLFLLILGGRYGSIEHSTGKSYTQLEYEHAMREGIPSFSVVMTRAALEKKAESEGTWVLEAENPDKYEAFKRLVLSKICKHFDDYKDIKLAVMQKLSERAQEGGAGGWVSVKELVGMGFDTIFTDRRRGRRGTKGRHPS